MLGRGRRLLQRLPQAPLQGLVGQLQLHHVGGARHGLVHLHTTHLLRSHPAPEGQPAAVVHEPDREPQYYQRLQQPGHAGCCYSTDSR